MDSERATTALTILLAIVVVATAAAGLIDGGHADGGASAGLGDGNGTGVGSGHGSAFGFNGTAISESLAIPGWIVSLAIGAILLTSFAAGVVSIGLLAWRGRLSELRRALTGAAKSAAAVLVLFAGLLLLMFALSQVLGEGGGGLMGSATGGTLGGEAAGDSTSLDAAGIAPLFVIGGGLVLLGLFAVLASPEEESEATVESNDAGEEPTVPPARKRGFLFHGEGDDASATNDVYHAWERLASEVGATGTATPAEVSRDAVDSGYDPDAVAELTALFREVRYGDAAIADDRERRARELRERLRGTATESM